MDSSQAHGNRLLRPLNSTKSQLPLWSDSRSAQRTQEGQYEVAISRVLGGRPQERSQGTDDAQCNQHLRSRRDHSDTLSRDPEDLLVFGSSGRSEGRRTSCREVCHVATRKAHVELDAVNARTQI